MQVSAIKTHTILQDALQWEVQSLNAFTYNMLAEMLWVSK